MLPTRLVTFVTFLLELCASSPVYNMQPAFITANIGTTSGRNIRNLPCISRKNNQSGVCMFAIDCLKANGTHLGTCIDRFYFGSCCHIEPPVHDINENTIDTDIIPEREPPFRLSSTIKPLSVATTILLPSTEATFGDKITTTQKATTIKPSTTTPTTTTTSTTATSKPITIRPLSGEKPTKIPALFPETTTRRKIITTTTKTTTRTTPKPKPIDVSNTEETTIGYKLTTFQSVDGISSIETTTPKIVSTTKIPIIKPTRPLVTKKPKPPITTKPSIKPTIRPGIKPKPTQTSTKKPEKITKPSLIKTTSKPIRYTTTRRRPVNSTTRPTILTTNKITRFPVTTKPTKKVVTKTATTTTTTTSTTTSTTTTQPPTVTTKEPSTVTSTKRTPPITTTASIIKFNTTEDDQILETTTTKQIPEKLTTLAPNDIPSNKLNMTSILESVNGNPATNEIETVKPIITSTTIKPATTETTTTTTTKKPVIVTWTVVDDEEKNTTKPSSVITTTVNSTSEEWVPITTPDGWVLLPSVSSNTSSDTKAPTTSTTGKPITTPMESTSTSRPSITYIPFESTTSISLTLNVSTTEIPSSSSSSSTSSPSPSTTTTTSSSTTATPTTSTSSSEIRPVNMSDFTDVCGRRMYPEARIVGGEKSSFGKWPWQVSLRQWRTSTYLHKCGAALLNENWAITAAHCVDNVPPSDLLLRLGEHDLSTESEPYLHQERRVQIVASHPQFDPRTFEYDLALLRFYEPITFQPNIIPVCVPQSDENFVGRTAYVTGWGRLYEDGPLPSILQEVSVPVINNSVCESMYRAAGYIEHIPHIFICAGWRRGGFDSCEGDSGGPMVIQREDKRFMLAGVISWGIGCAEPNQPGVYTRISEFRDWINQILQF